MRAALGALCLASAVAVCACANSDNAPLESSLYGTCTDIDASTTCVQDAGFEVAIVPILQKSCLKNCHDGSSAAIWPLNDYEDVQNWSDFVSQDIIECTMPPAAEASTYPITRQDRETILNWIICGAPP
jgi:hypothetical protein